MKRISIIFFALLLSLIFSVNVSVAGTGGTIGSPPAHEGTVGNPPANKLDNPIKVDSIQALMLTIVDLAIYLGAIVAAFMFFWVGFQLVMARGNSSAIKDAQAKFLAVVIGTAILISSKVIVEVIKNTLISSGVVEEKAFNLPK